MHLTIANFLQFFSNLRALHCASARLATCTTTPPSYFCWSILYRRSSVDWRRSLYWLIIPMTSALTWRHPFLSVSRQCNLYFLAGFHSTKSWRTSRPLLHFEPRATMPSRLHRTVSESCPVPGFQGYFLWKNLGFATCSPLHCYVGYDCFAYQVSLIYLAVKWYFSNWGPPNGQGMTRPDMTGHDIWRISYLRKFFAYICSYRH